MTAGLAIVVCSIALGASALTFFSGFGLGTLLLPAFALVFPIEIAISATAIVHLANNVFKLGLIGRHAKPRVVAVFGLPAVVAAFAGAVALGRIADLDPVARYVALGRTVEVEATELLVGALVILFAIVELSPSTRARTLDAKALPFGGLLSGFFGGLSGHQGALRSAFLIRAGLTKEGFVGTGVACAVLIDVARLTVYGPTVVAEHVSTVRGTGGVWVLGLATAFAFGGAVVGRRLLHKVTLDGVRRTVGALLLLVGLGLMSGWIGK